MHEATSFTNILAIVTGILGLPGTLFLFFNGQVVVGVLVLLLVIGVIGGAWAYRWHTNQPSVTFVNQEKTLTFEDKDAHIARQLSKIRVRANHKGVQRFKVGQARGDGPMKNLLVDGEPPTHVENVLGAKELYKVFDPPLGFREERDMEVSFQWQDSYPASTESWRHPTGHKTQKLLMKVVFHQDRPCKDARARVSYSGEVDEWIPERIVVSPNKRELTLQVSKPKRGAEYILEWDW